MSFLLEILERKRGEVAARRASLPEQVLERRVSEVRAVRDSFSAKLSPSGGRVAIIAEVKRASPSLGAIRPSLDALTQVRSYSAGGAAAISILTDGPGFGGSIADLAEAASSTSLPLLRKDFVIDRYQLLEARDAGASAALLIVAALSRSTLRQLIGEAESIGLETLVEVHDEAELEIALSEGARVVGVNNRDLKTFKVDLGVSERLAPRIPSSVRAVSESGVRNVEDVVRLRSAGFANFLIGEALVRADDPGALLRQFIAGGQR